MSQNKENKNINSENSDKVISKENKSIPKKNNKKKKYLKKSSKRQLSDAQIKVIPLLKPPSKCRKFGKSQNLKKKNNGKSIAWDNKAIEEQILDRKLHPRIKIDEKKTLYPNGDDEDLYQEGINKVNEIKPTKEIINNVIKTLNKMDKIENNNKDNKLKNKVFDNEYLKALKIYQENIMKCDDLSGERIICLKNTLINKFHKEVRTLYKMKL